MIDIRLDDEQQLIRDTVTSFASEQIQPLAHEADETATIPAALIDQAWELGLIQASIPEAYGGYGQPASAVTGAIIAEALAEGDLAIAMHILSPRLVVDPVLHLGNKDQQAAILPTYAGEKFVPGSAAVIEPRWNFSAGQMQTTAVQSGSEYAINGEKTMVALAKDAPYMVVYTGDESGATTAFVVPQGTPGVEIGERNKQLGVHALETYDVRFNDCRVPAGAKLDGDARTMLRRARVAQTAMAVGVAKASLDYAIVYAKDREAFGVKIAQKQAIAFMLADMAIEVDASRLLNWEAAWNLDSGNEAVREIALAHSYGNDSVMTVTDNGLQVLGGHGFVRDHPVERWVRNGRGFSTFEGMASV